MLKQIYLLQLAPHYEQYTPLDQVASITGSVNDKTQYTQTVFNKSTEINSPDTGNSQYTYDANGNIIINAVGNITNDGLRQYKYTAGNQLSSVLSAGKTTAYSYDVNNRRVSKTSGTSSTAYMYAEDIGEGSTALSANSLLGEYTANNSNIISKEYIYLGDTPIAVVQAGNILTVQTDHLDTPRQLTDNTKKIVWNWAYSAFGENQPTTTNNTVFNLRYPGQYYDAESKLHYNINRYYDPATGRYTQSDPIGLSGGINTYTYVGGNSIRYVDKSGLNAVASGYAGAGVGTAVFPGIGTVVGGVVGLGVGIWATDAAIDAVLDAYANYKKAANDTSAQQNSDEDSDETIYPNNPGNDPDGFQRVTSTSSAAKCKKDGSIWDRDYSSHGGKQWKRWPNERSWKRGKTPNSIWDSTGRIRK